MTDHRFLMPTVYIRATADIMGRGVQLMIPVSRVTWEHDLRVPPPPRPVIPTVNTLEYYDREVKRAEEATQRLRDGVIRREAEKEIMRIMKITWHEEPELDF